MTDNKWFNLNSMLNIKSATYFNDVFVLDSVNVTNLANFIINPGLAGIFQNPSDWLSSLTLYPFNPLVYRQPATVYKLQIASNDNTGIQAYPLNTGISIYDLGETFVRAKSGDITFKDYNGYTSIDVWLPFYGFVSVSPNDVMGKYMQFRMSVNYQTGMGTWYIGVTDNSVNNPSRPLFNEDLDANTRILSIYTFKLGIDIPLGSTNTGDIYRNIILGAVKTASIATGAYLGGITPNTTMTTTSTMKTKNTRRNPATGRQRTASTKTTQKDTTVEWQKPLDYSAPIDTFNVAADTILNANMRTTSDSPANTISALHGSMSIKVVIRTPKFKADTGIENYFGKPVGATKTIGLCHGFLKCGGVHVEGAGVSQATDDEKTEIETILKTGILLEYE